MKRCLYCNKLFEPRTFNQKYHDRECTKRATNENIMDKYYERKRNRAGEKRVCNENGCDTVLSRYNDERYCSIHSGFTYSLEFS